jgi:hypothetical protein
MSNSDKKITELPLASPLSLDDIFAVVQNGVTSQITLGEMMKSMRLTIPQPRVKILPGKGKGKDEDDAEHDQVFASWEGSDTNFLQFNPEFWLYRYRKSDTAKHNSKVKKGDLYEVRKKRFVHPSHMHGGIKVEKAKLRVEENTNYYKGEQVLLIKGEKEYLPGRQTEWAVSKDAYALTELLIEPWKYFRMKGLTGAETMMPKHFPTASQPMVKGTGSKNARMAVFKLRISIDNPDPKSPQPKLFGPFSETFIYYPNKFEGMFVNLKCFLGAEASPMLRRRLKPYSKV